MKSKIVFIVVLVVTFGGIFVADLLGYWQTTSTKQPSLLKEGDFVGMANPEDIRGSTSFGDIENYFGIESAMLARAFNLNTSNPADLKANDVKTAYEFLGEDVELGTGAVKMFVAIYNGIPLGEIENLPSTAVEELKEQGKWSDSVETMLEGFVIDVSSIAMSDIPTETSAEHEIESTVLTEIAGKTTVSDVINAGVSLEEVETILGIKIPNPNLTIRDLCDKNGLSFGNVKDALNEKLAK